MMKLAIEQIVKAVGGKLVEGRLTDFVTGVSTDSRQISASQVFFPLIGEQFDAHDFIPQAIEKGCITIITSKPIDERLMKEHNLNIIMVEDTTKALQDLASYYLSLFKIKKIGVTGSTGKTTTKDMLYWILSEKYKTTRNIGNFNNHIGLPLTIFSLEEDTEVGIFEMGMSELGEINLLAEVLNPDVGVITNIGMSHIENLGSRENILKAKLEITNYFGPNNMLIVNGDNEFLTKENVEGNYQLITIGETGRSNYIISNIKDFGEEGIEFTLEHDNEIQIFRTFVPGRHNAFNGALAIAAGHCMGVTLKEAAEGLKKMVITDKRLNIKGKNGMKIIDDTYNASPDSMKAAIDVLVATKGFRKIAILGDMFELGESAGQYHFDVGKYAGQSSLDKVIAIGNNARYIAEGALAVMDKNNVTHYETKELLIQNISSIISSGDVILLKGSRGMAMDQVVKKIMETE